MLYDEHEEVIWTQEEPTYTFVCLFICLFVHLLRSKFTPTHSLSLRSPDFQNDTQPLGTQKYHATSRDKKNRATSYLKKKSNNLSGQKKIMQPVRTKIIMQPLGTKNIMQPLRTKKNCATSLNRKITQIPRTKKLHNLSGQTNHAISLDIKNHATS